MLHLREDEGVTARAMLYMVLLALQANSSSQQVGQVGKGHGQRVAHVKEKGKGREGTEMNKVVAPLGRANK